MAKAEKMNSYVAIVLKGKEMKLTSLHMSARGQGHLLTFAKVIWVKSISAIFIKKYNKAKWKYISYESNLGWKK